MTYDDLANRMQVLATTNRWPVHGGYTADEIYARLTARPDIYGPMLTLERRWNGPAPPPAPRGWKLY